MKTMRQSTANFWASSRLRFLVLVSCVTALSSSGLAQNLRKPLSEREVIHLVENHVPPDHIADIARLYRLSFQITPEIEKKLREVGGTEDLVNNLKALPPPNPVPAPVVPELPTGTPSPAPVLIVSSTTGDVEVYVDDVRQGKTSSDGLLKVLNLSPGPRRLRVSRDGYSDFQDMVALKLGETTTRVIPPLQPANHSGSQTASVGPVAPSAPASASAPSSPTTSAATQTNDPLASVTGEPIAVKDAFHVIGIPALKPNNKFDLTITTRDMMFTEHGQRVYRIPFGRVARVQMNVAERHYAKATYGAVVAFGAPGALLLAKKRHVDALIIDYTNERGGEMQMVIQVPKGMGTPCLDRLAHAGVMIGSPDESVASTD
jgi:hypothetical protein